MLKQLFPLKLAFVSWRNSAPAHEILHQRLQFPTVMPSWSESAGHQRLIPISRIDQRVMFGPKVELDDGRVRYSVISLPFSVHD